MEIKSEPEDAHGFPRDSEVSGDHKQTVHFKTENFENANLSLKEGGENQLLSMFIKKEKVQLSNKNLSPHTEDINEAFLKCTCSNKQKTFVCSSCDYSTDHKSGFIPHLKIHSGKHFLKRVECGCKTTYQNHVKGRDGKRPFKCSECRKSKMNSYIMKSKEKIFHCSSCGFKATGKQHQFQKQHEVICNRVEKPFTCSSCDYKCVTQSALTDHLVTHIGKNPFPCSICNFRTNSNENLKAHIKTHKPFTCTICDYRCATQPTLNMHMKALHVKREETIRCEAESESVAQERTAIDNCDLKHKTIKVEEVYVNGVC